METRLKRNESVDFEWHWKETLQVFTPDTKAFQFNFESKTFNIKPWEINTLPIGFGVKKGSTDIIIFIGSEETQSSLSPNRIRQWIYENCKGVNTK